MLETTKLMHRHRQQELLCLSFAVVTINGNILLEKVLLWLANTAHRSAAVHHTIHDLSLGSLRRESILVAEKQTDVLQVGNPGEGLCWRELLLLEDNVLSFAGRLLETLNCDETCSSEYKHDLVVNIAASGNGSRLCSRRAKHNNEALPLLVRIGLPA